MRLSVVPRDKQGDDKSQSQWHRVGRSYQGGGLNHTQAGNKSELTGRRPDQGPTCRGCKVHSIGI